MPDKPALTDRVEWSGRVLAVQPRIRLLRSFDQRSHIYQGYVLRIGGTRGGQEGEFLIAVGKGAQAKHGFCIGMCVSGIAALVPDPRLETAAFYRTSQIRVSEKPESQTILDPPVVGVPPDLQIYRERGHRRLDTRTYESNCRACIWGCKMPVEIIVDHWNPSDKSYRFETFCYGPKSCSSYHAGPTRKVPGRRGMIWEEEDWVDEDETSHRGPDE